MPVGTAVQAEARLLHASSPAMAGARLLDASSPVMAVAGVTRSPSLWVRKDQGT